MLSCIIYIYSVIYTAVIRSFDRQVVINLSSVQFSSSLFIFLYSRSVYHCCEVNKRFSFGATNLLNTYNWQLEAKVVEIHLVCKSNSVFFSVSFISVSARLIQLFLGLSRRLFLLIHHSRHP